LPEQDPDFDPVLGYEDDPELEPAPEPEPHELWPRDDNDFLEEPATPIPPALQAPPEAPGSPQVGDQRPGQAKRRKDKVHFLMGPVCLDWAVRALVLRKPAIAVGIGLWLEVGLEKDHFLRSGQSESKPIRVGRKFKRRLGITPSQSSRGIHALEAAGLIRIVKGGAGRCPEVRIVNLQPKRRVGNSTSPPGRVIAESHSDRNTTAQQREGEVP
jgi:hypothetical protein